MNRYGPVEEYDPETEITEQPNIAVEMPTPGLPRFLGERDPFRVQHIPLMPGSFHRAVGLMPGSLGMTRMPSRSDFGRTMLQSLSESKKLPTGEAERTEPEEISPEAMKAADEQIRNRETQKIEHWGEGGGESDYVDDKGNVVKSSGSPLPGYEWPQPGPGGLMPGLSPAVQTAIDQAVRQTRQTPVRPDNPNLIDPTSYPTEGAFAAGGTVDRNHDVPYLAGSSRNGRTTYIDRRVPRELQIGNRAMDPAKYLAIHEQVEHHLMTKGRMPYHVAHQHALHHERMAVQADGHDWGQYQNVMHRLAEHVTEPEKVTHPPPDLYTKPYPHHEAAFLQRKGRSDHFRKGGNVPATSKAQYRLMAAVKHNPDFAKTVGIPQSVGRDFVGKPQHKFYESLPGRVKHRADGGFADENPEPDLSLQRTLPVEELPGESQYGIQRPHGLGIGAVPMPSFALRPRSVPTVQPTPNPRFGTEIAPSLPRTYAYPSAGEQAPSRTTITHYYPDTMDSWLPNRQPADIVGQAIAGAKRGPLYYQMPGGRHEKERADGGRLYRQDGGTAALEMLPTYGGGYGSSNAGQVIQQPAGTNPADDSTTTNMVVVMPPRGYQGGGSIWPHPTVLAPEEDPLTMALYGPRARYSSFGAARDAYNTLYRVPQPGPTVAPEPPREPPRAFYTSDPSDMGPQFAPPVMRRAEPDASVVESGKLYQTGGFVRTEGLAPRHLFLHSGVNLRGPTPYLGRETSGSPYQPKIGHVGGLLSPVAGRTDHIPLDVPNGAYVLPADVISGLGEGNTIHGTKVANRMFRGHFRPPRRLSMHHSLFGRSAGGVSSGAPGGNVPIMAAGGEYVVPPEAVAKVGRGDMKEGHAILDLFVKKVRNHTIKTLQKLPGPAKK